MSEVPLYARGKRQDESRKRRAGGESHLLVLFLIFALRTPPRGKKKVEIGEDARGKTARHRQGQCDRDREKDNRRRRRRTQGGERE